uniref:Threonine--tRNA ligase n=1 Tax=OCS116 cluster bacterium TaxID=2030921 RepID=A0A2A4Z7N2_9PROT
MINITFPDGAKREYETGQTGFDIALSISKSLSKKAVAVTLNGEMQDLAEPILADAELSIILRDDEAALELIRHDAAHVMAEAVQELFPGTQVTIGPVIENGFYYDFARDEPFHEEDLVKIEAKMRQIIGRDAKFEKEVWTRDQAKQFFAAKGEDYKVELIDLIPADEDVKIYKQGEWLDLCRGPHLPSTGKIGNNFKLMKLAGAYWRGNSDNAMLQRIYGTAWASEKQLKQYLYMLEEAEKRDHRKLGAEMNLFHFQNEAPGSVFWHPKGWSLFSSLIGYMRRKQTAGGYLEVNTPDMLDKALWEQSGHWEKYGENMFTTITPDEREFALKPMNCPGHVQIFKNGLRSYKELPIRLGEFGKVHRYEPSGALHGLMRVRSFTQDDAHIFCTDEQVTDEVIKTNELILSIYKDFGFEDIRVKFSDRPEKRIGSDESWDKSEAALRNAITKAGVEWELNSGEGAFYGPKLEYVLRDAIGRDWQCGTLQVDLNLPERFGAFYIDKDGEKQTPVMLHRAMFGSLERFTGILIEHHAGAFPMWLAPEQVVVCPIVSDMDDYALEVRDALRAAGISAEVDLRNEKINYKVREHSLQKIPAIFVVGGREKENGTVAIRRFGSKAQTILPLAEAVTGIALEARAPDQV